MHAPVRGSHMFDSIGAFTRQFTPVDGGYLYYSSRKEGGKLVTVEEFEELVTDWQRVAGKGGTWRTVGLVAVAILLWTLISRALALPGSADWIVILGSVSAVSGWLLWASLAPRRLVKNRPTVTPPRPVAQAKREARAALNWPFVIFFLLASGAIFLGCLSAPSATPSWWAWLIGSGFMFGAYLWICFQKLKDRQG